MLEKMLDLKNTFEGKFIAVFMSVVLVLSMSNLTAFAEGDAEADAATNDTAAEQPIAEPTANEAPVVSAPEPESQPVETPVQPSVEAPAPEVNTPSVTEPPVTTEVGEAVVTFEVENATVSVKEQIIYGKTLTTELHKELKFTASVAEGFEIEPLKAQNSANVEVPVTTQDGISTIAAEYVDSTLVVTVKAAAVESEVPGVPETEPITSDTKIEASKGTTEPEAEGEGFALLSSSDDSRTVVEKPGTYSVRVNYLYSNGSLVEQPYAVMRAATKTDAISLEVPSRDGYTPSVSELDPTAGNASLTKEGYLVVEPTGASDIEVTITYSGVHATYKVHHLFQNLDPSDSTGSHYGDSYYTEDESAMETPEGEVAMMTSAQGLVRTGFSQIAVVNNLVKEDGSTDAYVYYDRQNYTVSYDAGVGTIEYRYGQSMSTSEPERPGFEFNGWRYVNERGEAVSLEQGTMPAFNLVASAQWVEAEASYEVAVWLQNANDTGYSYVANFQLKGVTGATVGDDTWFVETIDSIQASFADVVGSDEVGYYSFNTSKSAAAETSIAGNGTTTVNVYFDRNAYSIKFYYAKVTPNGKVYVATSTKGSVTGAGWVNLPWISPDNIPAGDGVDTIEGNNYYYFSLSAKYGEEIASTWPASKLNTIGAWKFVSWGTQEGSGYWETHDNKNIKGVYSTMSSELIMSPQNKEAQSMVAYGTKGTPFLYTYEIYYQNVGDTEYTLVTTYENVRSTDLAKAQNALSFPGVTFDHRVCVGGENARGGTVKFFYTRNDVSVSLKNINSGYVPSQVTSEMKSQGIRLENGKLIGKYGSDMSCLAGLSDGLNYPFSQGKGAWRFAGWCLDPVGEVPYFNGEEPCVLGEESVVLYAGWKAPTYAVSFDLDGGSWTDGNAAANNSQEVSEGKTAIEPTEPQKEGYTFGGWFTQDETRFFFSNGVTADMNLVARWVPNVETYTYKIICNDAKTGEDISSRVKDQSTLIGSAPANETVAIKAPMIESFAPSQGVVSKIIGQNQQAIVIDYYPATTYQYKVSYVDEGGMAIKGDRILDVVYQEIVENAAEIPGYTPKQAQQSAAGSQGSVTEITFVYTQDKYTVTYEPGDLGAFEKQTTVDLTYGMNTPAFVGEVSGEPGARFEGWLADTGKLYASTDDLPKTVTGSATYTAQWVMTYNVTYKPGTDELVTGMPDPATVEGIIAGSSQAVSTAVPMRAGYTFAGWNVDPATVDVNDGSFTMPANDVVFIAQWTADFSALKATGFNVKYDGGAHTVLVEGTLATDTIEYFVNGEKLATNSFVNVADSASVTVRVTRGGEMKELDPVEATITKRVVTITSRDAARQYNGEPLAWEEWDRSGDTFVQGEEPVLTFTGSVTNVADTKEGNNVFTYAFPEGVNAGNYEMTTEFGTLTITPAPLSVTVTGAQTWATYDGNPHKAEGFAVGDEAAGKATITLKDDAEALVEQVAAGTYPMGLTEESFNVSSDNYTVTLVVVDGQLDIAHANTLNVGATPVVKPYDGIEAGVHAQASVEGAQIRYYNENTQAFDLTTSPEFKDVGVYTVRFQATLDNYTPQEGTATVTITKRPVTLTSGTAKQQYNGTALKAENVTVSGDGFVSGEGATYSEYASLVDVDAIENTFMYTLNEGTNASNYAITVALGTLEVTKAPLTVRVVGAVKSVQYDGALQQVEGYQVLDDIAGKATVSLADGISAYAEGTAVDTYPMGLTSTSFAVDSRNYEVTLSVEDGKLTITPSSELTMEASPVETIYDGTRHGVEPVTNIPGATVTYWSDEAGDYTLTESPTFLDVTGEPRIVKFKASYANYQDAYGETTVEVSKRPVTVASVGDEQVYDGAPLKNATVQVGGYGFVNGETPAYNVTGSQTDAGFSLNAFELVFPDGVNADNYTITKSEGILTVTKAALTVNIVGNHDTVTFNGDVHEVNDFVVGSEADGKATIALKDNALAHAEGTNAATYYMGLTADSFTVDSLNYNVTLVVTDGYLAINPAGVMTVNADNVAKTYDGERVGVEAKASVEGAVVTYFNDATGVFDLAESPTFLDVTNEPQVVRFQATHPNYQTVEGAATVDVAKRPVSLTSANASKMYNGEALSAQKVTESGSGFVKDEGASYTNFAGITDAGIAKNTFDYMLNEGTNASNYAITVVPGTLEVTKAPLSVTITGNHGAGIYNGSAHTVDGFTAVGADGKATVSLKDGALAQVQATNAGTYPMGLTAEDFTVNSKNYDVTMTVIDGSLTVSPATLLIAASDATKMYGQDDPVLAATVTGLVSGDEFKGSYDVTRASGEAVGAYPVSVENAISGDPNYVIEVAEGSFVITPADAVSIVVGGGTKVYDGTPLTPSTFTPSGLAEGDYVEVVYSGSQTDAGSSASGVASYIIRNAAGDDVTANYANVTVVPGTLTVVSAEATIVVADAAKVAGAADPAFSGTVSGLVSDDDLGVISYVRTGNDETPGTYSRTLTATYTANPNYTVTVVPGTFTITAVPVVPVTPPVTPDGTPTPATPTPLPTPGTVPADGGPVAAVVAPVAQALQAAVETVIGDNATPLAQGEPRETEISDNGTPLAGGDHAWCWVHWYIILGIIVTAIYAACVALRRGLFSHKLKKYEDNLTGGGDPAPGTPSRTDESTASTGVPTGMPAGATMVAGLGE